MFQRKVPSEGNPLTGDKVTPCPSSQPVTMEGSPPPGGRGAGRSDALRLLLARREVVRRPGNPAGAPDSSSTQAQASRSQASGADQHLPDSPSASSLPAPPSGRSTPMSSLPAPASTSSRSSLLSSLPAPPSSRSSLLSSLPAPPPSRSSLLSSLRPQGAAGSPAAPLGGRAALLQTLRIKAELGVQTGPSEGERGIM